MSNCLSQSFNNDCSWCEKKHQSMIKIGKHVTKHISFLVIQLKNLSHKYQSTTLMFKIFAWIYNNFNRYSNKWEGSYNIWYKSNKVLNLNTTKASFQSGNLVINTRRDIQINVGLLIKLDAAFVNFMCKYCQVALISKRVIV